MKNETKETSEKYRKLESQNIENSVEYNQFSDEQVMVTKDFFNYFHPSFERKIFILHLIPYCEKELEDGIIFKGVVFKSNSYYYYVKENDNFYYYPFGDTDFERKLERLILNTKIPRYIVECTYGWDDDCLHLLKTFDTEKEAKEFVAENEKWKEEFKDKFGVIYDSLKEETDFTQEMKDWLNKFAKNETVKYFIKEV